MGSKTVAVVALGILLRLLLLAVRGLYRSTDFEVHRSADFEVDDSLSDWVGVNDNDLTATSLGTMVTGNHLLLWPSFRLMKYGNFSGLVGIHLGKSAGLL